MGGETWHGGTTTTGVTRRGTTGVGCTAVERLVVPAFGTLASTAVNPRGAIGVPGAAEASTGTITDTLATTGSLLRRAPATGGAAMSRSVAGPERTAMTKGWRYPRAREAEGWLATLRNSVREAADGRAAIGAGERKDAAVPGGRGVPARIAAGAVDSSAGGEAAETTAGSLNTLARWRSGPARRRAARRRSGPGPDRRVPRRLSRSLLASLQAPAQTQLFIIQSAGISLRRRPSTFSR